MAYSHGLAAETAVDAQHRSCGFHDFQSPPSRRRTKRGQLSRGRNRAGITTKLHLVITTENHVVEGLLTGGNVADIAVADDLMADVVGCYVAEDMGYDSDDHRRALEANNNVPVIPGRKNRKIEILYDKAIYKWRRRIEMFFGKLKENRRLAVRYEKLDATFLGFIALAIVKAFYLC
ncbi:MAG: transposase [Methylocella sp.]